MHLAHEVGIVEGNGQKITIEKGLAHEGLYQVDAPQRSHPHL